LLALIRIMNRIVIISVWFNCGPGAPDGLDRLNLGSIDLGSIKMSNQELRDRQVPDLFGSIF
jgi:hypothetical protein